MSAGDYALNALLIAVVIRQVRGKRLTVAGLVWPIALVGVAAVKYLHGIPTAGNDAALVVAGGVVGAGLGAGAGLLTDVRALPGGGLLAKASVPAAVLWVTGTGARMGFALFAENGGAAAIARFSAANRITGASAWTSCLILMALAEVVGRTAALAWRGRRVRAAAPAAASVQEVADAGGRAESRKVALALHQLGGFQRRVRRGPRESTADAYPLRPGLGNFAKAQAKRPEGKDVDRL